MSSALLFRQFLLMTFAMLIPAFALWMAISHWLGLPAIGLVNILLQYWMPEIVQALFVQDTQAVLMTRFESIDNQIVSEGAGEYGVGFTVDTRILTYSIPFYSALYFATPGRKPGGNFFVGLLLLYILFVFGLVSLVVKDMMVHLGTIFLQHPTAAVPPGAAIGLLYQFNVLLVPTLGPVLIWAWQSADTPLLQPLIDRTQKTSAQ